MSNDPTANMMSLEAICDELDDSDSTLIDRITLCCWLSAMRLMADDARRAAQERDEARTRNREALLNVITAQGEAQDAYAAQLAAEKERDRLRRGICDALDTDRHNFYDGGPPRWTTILRAALRGDAG